MSTPKQFRNDLYDRAQKLVDEAIRVVDDHPDNPDYPRILFEVWSRNMGAIDALFCLRGFPKDARKTSLVTGIHEGRKLILRAHEATCPNCDGSKQLQEELAGVN